MVYQKSTQAYASSDTTLYSFQHGHGFDKVGKFCEKIWDQINNPLK